MTFHYNEIMCAARRLRDKYKASTKDQVKDDTPKLFRVVTEHVANVLKKQKVRLVLLESFQCTDMNYLN